MNTNLKKVQSQLTYMVVYDIEVLTQIELSPMLIVYIDSVKFQVNIIDI